MRRNLAPAGLLIALILGVAACATFQPEAAPGGPAPTVGATATPAVRRADPAAGRYLATIGLCLYCHTAEGGQPAAGGRTLVAPGQGRLVAGNLTPDKSAGLGDWSDAEIKGGTLGVAKGDKRLAPLMPYSSYGRLSVQDLDDLVAYLKSLPPQGNRTPASELVIPRDDLPRPPRPTGPQRAPTAGVGRGEYLTLGVAACGLCHTPRTPTGQPDGARILAGATVPYDASQVAPNITPHRETGIGGWDKAAIIKALKEGAIPSGKTLGSIHGPDSPYRNLTSEDLAAVADYLLSLPAQPSAVSP